MSIEIKQENEKEIQVSPVLLNLKQKDLKIIIDNSNEENIPHTNPKESVDHIRIIVEKIKNLARSIL